MKPDASRGAEGCLLISNNCPICGQPIPERKPGDRHGSPPKTCSEACRRDRANRLERARYQRIKAGPEWRETRANYLKRLRSKLDADPAFATIFRARAAARMREWHAKLRATNPDRHAELKAQARAERVAWRARLVTDPEAWEAHKAACRAWYASLSNEDRERIFYAPRRARMKEIK